ncbi:MAG: hypothetical protein ACYTGZ_20020 [Planctomycetota bacterium]
MERPLVAFFDQSPGRRFLQFNETRPRKEAGLEMCLMFLPPRQAPTRWRVPLPHAPGRSKVDGSVLVFPVSPADGSMRPARMDEVRWALYVVAALDKAWRAGDIHPGQPEATERVPMLHLDGPPEDPRYRTSTILLKTHGEFAFGQRDGTA